MRKITEVLRLKAAGMNIRAIAQSVGAGKTTVYEYLARAEAAGVGWPLLPVYNLICRRAYRDICRSSHPEHRPLTRD